MVVLLVVLPTLRPFTSLSLVELPGRDLALEQLVKFGIGAAFGLWHEKCNQDVDQSAGAAPEEHLATLACDATEELE